jgi:hypothetical protein
MGPCRLRKLSVHLTFAGVDRVLGAGAEAIRAHMRDLSAEFGSLLHLCDGTLEPKLWP